MGGGTLPKVFVADFLFKMGFLTMTFWWAQKCPDEFSNHGHVSKLLKIPVFVQRTFLRFTKQLGSPELHLPLFSRVGGKLQCDVSVSPLLGDAYIFIQKPFGHWPSPNQEIRFPKPRF